MPGPLRSFFGYHMRADRFDRGEDRISMRVRVFRTKIFKGTTECVRIYPVRGFEGRWECLSDAGVWHRLPRWVEVDINAYWKMRKDAAAYEEAQRRKMELFGTPPSMSTSYL